MLVSNMESLAFSNNTDKELAYDDSVKRNIKVIRHFIFQMVGFKLTKLIFFIKKIKKNCVKLI